MCKLTESRTVRGRWWLALAAFALVALPALGAPFGADPEQAAALLERLGDRYEVLTLTDSYVLQPTDPDADFRAIEVKASSVAVDSEPVSRSELEELVGEDAELVFELAELGSAEWSATEELRLRIERMAEERRLEVQEIEALIRERAEEIESLEAEHLEVIEEALEDQRRAERNRHREARRGRVRRDTRVSFGSSLTIEDNETSQDVVVLGGSLDIEGDVSGDATVVGGSAEVKGEVSGTVTAVGGSIFLGPDARIFGDALSIGGAVHRDPTAEIYGEITEVSLGPGVELDDLWEGIWMPDWLFGWFDFGMGRLAFKVALTVFLTMQLLIILLLFPRLTAAVSQRAEHETWKAGLAGLGAQLLFLCTMIVICGILVLTVVGIPLAVILLLLACLVLAIFFLLGYAGVAMAGGRLLQRRFGWQGVAPYLLVLLGVLLIQGWSILAVALGSFGGPVKIFAWLMVPLGFAIKYVAWTIGLGAILLHRFSSRPAGPAIAPPPPAPDEWEALPAAEESPAVEPEASVDLDDEYLLAGEEPDESEPSDESDPSDPSDKSDSG
ncbi:MAG: hypothetical protein GY719_05160 [bacterium]|nr:hypothetical protein [bacterium]